MKKLGTVVGVLLLSGVSGHAQEATENYPFKSASAQVLDQSYKAVPSEPRRTSSPLFHLKDRALDTIWSENFSSAQIGEDPGQWTTGGANGNLWKIGDPDNLVVYSSEIKKNKPYLYWDSYTTIGATSGGAERPASGSVSSPTIDLSGAGDLSGGALLRMTTDAQYCCHRAETPFRIYFSNDGGTNWSDTITPDFGINRNIILSLLNGGPLVFSVDISPYLSAVAAENSSIRFKFEWNGKNADSNDQHNSSYAWLIDDLHIVKLPDYEVSQQSLWLADITRAYEATQIPQGQLSKLSIQSKVLSLGSKTPSNFRQQVFLYDDESGQLQENFPKEGGELLGGAADTLVRAQMDTITFKDAIDISDLPIGRYRVEVKAEYDESGQDAVPSNNILSRKFYITSNELGGANYDKTAYIDGDENQDEEVEIGSMFFISKNSVELHGVNLLIDNVTSGIEVEVNVYERTGSLEYRLIGGPYPFTLDYNEAWKDRFWHTFNLHQSKAASSPVTLSNFSFYLVTVRIPKRGLDGSNQFDFVRSSSDADESGRIKRGTDDWALFNFDPYMTLNFDKSLSVEEKVKLSPFHVAQNVPNPFDQQTVISYTLEEAADVGVTFTDISGKVVRTVNKGIQPSGSHQLTVEAGDFAKGIYFYTFAIGGQRVTKKMVVNSFE